MSAKDTNANALSVFMDNVHVGTLHNDEPLSFSYDEAWLVNPAAKPLDPQIPLHAEKIVSLYVYAFFENLLPRSTGNRPEEPASLAVFQFVCRK